MKLRELRENALLRLAAAATAIMLALASPVWAQPRRGCSDGGLV
jgi:hypothetical protein